MVLILPDKPGVLAEEDPALVHIAAVLTCL